MCITRWFRTRVSSMLNNFQFALTRLHSNGSVWFRFMQTVHLCSFNKKKKQQQQIVDCFVLHSVCINRSIVSHSKQIGALFYMTIVKEKRMKFIRKYWRFLFAIKACITKTYEMERDLLSKGGCSCYICYSIHHTSYTKNSIQGEIELLYEMAHIQGQIHCMPKHARQESHSIFSVCVCVPHHSY